VRRRPVPTISQVFSQDFSQEGLARQARGFWPGGRARSAASFRSVPEFPSRSAASFRFVPELPSRSGASFRSALARR